MPKPRKGNWKTVNSRVIHRNPWYHLRHDKVLRPDGSPGDYFYISGTDSALVVAVDRSGRILLVGQNRYPIGNKYSWEIAAGGVPQGQKPLEVARRELQEEGGLAAKKWTSLGSFFPYNGVSADKSYCFLAEDLSLVEGQPEATENITRRWFSPSQIITMIKRGAITDGMSLAALHLYFLKNRTYRTKGLG